MRNGYLTELQVEIIGEKLFDDWFDHFLIHGRRQKFQIDQILRQPLHVFFDNVEERVNQLAL